MVAPRCPRNNIINEIAFAKPGQVIKVRRTKVDRRGRTMAEDLSLAWGPTPGVLRGYSSSVLLAALEDCGLGKEPGPSACRASAQPIELSL